MLKHQLTGLRSAFPLPPTVEFPYNDALVRRPRPCNSGELRILTPDP